MNRSFYQRYINGEREEVWEELLDLDEEAVVGVHAADAKAVLQETMERVRYNLKVIHQRLQDAGYRFHYPSEALCPPVKNTQELLLELEQVVKPYGFVPLSLKAFYSIVGSVNFIWDFDTPHLYPMSDPIVVHNLPETLEYLRDFKLMDENIDEGEAAYIEIAPDVYHKDNVSGGMAYSVALSDEPSIDSDLLFEDTDSSFIEYLRMCIEAGGFPGLLGSTDPNDIKFLDYLTRDLKPI